MSEEKYEKPLGKKQMRTFFELPEKKNLKSPEVKSESRQEPSSDLEDDADLAIMRRKGNYRYGRAKGQDFVEKYNQFVKEINVQIVKLNESIEEYNKLTDDEERLEALKDIFEYYRFVLKTPTGELVQYSNEFKSKLHDGIFLEIQNQAKQLGLSSLLNLEFSDPTISSQEYIKISNVFPKILADMSPGKTEELLKILSKGKKFDPDDFKDLYEPSEKGYKTFQNFLDNLKEIKCLGDGNSINFKISLKDGSAPFILKVDNRLGNPGTAENFLRTRPALADTFAPSIAERQVSTVVGKEPQTRTILITEFYKKGDLESYAEKMNRHERLVSASDIFIQMGTIVSKISDNDCGHPDLKMANFLVDDKGKLRLADTKALVFLDKDRNFNNKLMEQMWYGIASTRYMNPPEFDTDDTFSADAVHSYMLGKNLYQFLTQCDDRVIRGKHNGADYPFDHPIFATKEGETYRRLIVNLIKPNPADRMSVEDAVRNLKDMNLKLARTKDRTLGKLVQVKELLTDKAIRQYEKSIDNAETFADFKKLDADLFATVEDQCKELISDIKEASSDSKIGTVLKNYKEQVATVNTIEAMLNVKDALEFTLLKEKTKVLFLDVQKNGYFNDKDRQDFKERYANRISNADNYQDMKKVYGRLKEYQQEYREANKQVESKKERPNPTGAYREKASADRAKYGDSESDSDEEVRVHAGRR